MILNLFGAPFSRFVKWGSKNHGTDLCHMKITCRNGHRGLPEGQKHREHTAHEVDWNTIYVECERDIYSLIAKFAK